MLDVSLVVIGFIIVAISYFISEKLDQGINASSLEGSGQIHEIWSKKDEEKVTKQIEAITAKKVEETENHVDDELSRLSNEKIMAVDEFSNQILEKIEKNHKDVVFLYNMLNEKQEEIKKMITEADTAKTALEDSIRISKEHTPKTYTAVDMLQKISKESKNKAEQPEKLAEKEKEALKAIFNEPENDVQKETMAVEKIEKEQEESMNIEQEDTEKTEQDTVSVQSQESKEMPIEEAGIIKAEEEKKQTEPEKPSTKEQILQLYKEGKNILEISKLLHMGQGEVKLFIDLYQ